MWHKSKIAGRCVAGQQSPNHQLLPPAKRTRVKRPRCLQVFLEVLSTSVGVAWCTAARCLRCSSPCMYAHCVFAYRGTRVFPANIPNSATSEISSRHGHISYVKVDVLWMPRNIMYRICLKAISWLRPLIVQVAGPIVRIADPCRKAAKRLACNSLRLHRSLCSC